MAQRRLLQPSGPLLSAEDMLADLAEYRPDPASEGGDSKESGSARKAAAQQLPQQSMFKSTSFSSAAALAAIDDGRPGDALMALCDEERAQLEWALRRDGDDWIVRVHALSEAAKAAGELSVAAKEKLQQLMQWAKAVKELQVKRRDACSKLVGSLQGNIAELSTILESS
eukprot:jgi/Chlat1/5312/Chrsp35S08982